MSSDDEQAPQNISNMLTKHFQILISDDVEEITMQLFALDAENEANSQEEKEMCRRRGKIFDVVIEERCRRRGKVFVGVKGCRREQVIVEE
ncbi:hypothetical protein E3N88_18157 [Mikania micrantha]|uniref:Uncharacterized protein n=1 Tax=Mikania micrantha TaxID=192012 RepID=A0A5N6NU18_9ASTR|nr:hypothetical protein E3N88_18157 [Mikania micrantha]